MKNSRVFWGIAFLAAGCLLLLYKLDIFTIDWFSLWRYWPVVLVAWGVALLAKKPAFTIAAVIISALAAAVVVMSVVSFVWGGVPEGELTDNVNQYSVPYDPGVGRAVFQFESGAGTFELGDTTAHLMDATTHTGFRAYELDQNVSDGTARLNLSMPGRHTRWHFGAKRNSARIRLNPDPAWELRFSVGGARLDIDASQYKVERLDVNSGAAEVSIALSARAEESHVSVNSWASSIRILVPREAGCEFTVHGPLSSKSFSEFESIGGGKYRTSDFDIAGSRIYVNVNAGVSSLKVIRD